MDKINWIESENNKEKENVKNNEEHKEIKTLEEKSEDKCTRLGVSQSADQVLEALLLRINNKFLGGRVGKSELAEWLIIKSPAFFTEDMIQEVRSIYFDERAAFKNMILRIKDTGQIPQELRTLLQRENGVDKQTLKKKSKSTNSVDSI